MPKLTAPMPYFGSKRDLAPAIVAQFLSHDTYYSIFAGSLAELFVKPFARQEVASEKHPDVLNLLRCLGNEVHAQQLWMFSRSACLSETLFQEAVTRLMQPYDSSPNFERARDYLLVSWQGPSGLAGTKSKPRMGKRNTSSGGSTAARWKSVAEAIPEWHERLRSVEFRCQDAFELLLVIPDRSGVLVYADPPYHPDSRTGGEYVFELTLEQHRELAVVLSQFQKTRVVVSYRRCPATDMIYESWRRVDLEANRRLQHVRTGEQVAESAEEILYCNWS